MPATMERSAPPAPDEHPNNEALHRLVYGDKVFINDGSPDEPDEIVYEHPRGTWVTTREERARAQRIWNEEQRVPYPNNAEQNLARTEAMLRRRLTSNLSPAETRNAVQDQLTVTNYRLQQIENRQHAERPAEHTADQPDTDWATDSTGSFSGEVPYWANSATGNFEQAEATEPKPEAVATSTPEDMPEEPAESAGYVGRHRRRKRGSVPLAHLLRRKHRATSPHVS